MSTFGEPVRSERALLWVEAFPWLQGLPSSLADPDGGIDAWQQMVGPAGDPDRGRRIDILAQLVGTHLVKWSLAELFPAIADPDIRSALSVVDMGGGAAGIDGYAEGTLPDLNVLALSRICGGDVAHVDAALRWLVSRQLGIATAPEQVAEERTPRHGSGPAAAEEHDGRGAPSIGELTAGELAVVADLRAIAGFRRSTGDVADRLFANPNNLPLPASVSQAVKRIRLIRTSAIGVTGFQVDVAAILNELISDHAEVALVTLRQRLFADTPVTLDVVGKQFGVSRERIRQVAGTARAKLEGVIGQHPSLSMTNEGIAAAIGELLPSHALLSAYPALSDEVEAVGQPVWRVLDRLDDSYEIADGWCAAPSVEAARTSLLSKLADLASPHGVVSLDVLSGELPPYFGESTNRPDLERWCEYCGLELYGDFLIVGARSLPDRAAALLSIAQKPLSSGSLLEKVGSQRSLQSLKNAMGADQRFMRVDRDEWALVEWDLEEYTSIRGLIQSEIDRNDGEVSLPALVETICGKYSVKEASVTAYASAPPYETVDGMVRPATEARVPTRSPAETKRLYRAENAWLFRTEVTEDHMRGSGTGAPAAVATALELRHGGARHFSSDSGPLSIRWTGLSPSFGSIRQRLIQRRFRLHDPIFIVLYDSGKFDLRSVPKPSGRTDLDIAALTGVQMVESFQDFLTLCGRALGIPGAASLHDLLRQCTLRGDDDVQSLLEQYIAERREANERTADGSPPRMPTEGLDGVGAVGVVGEGSLVDSSEDSGLDDLVALQRDFRAAQYSGQYALAEQIQAEFGPRLRAYMKARDLDVEAVLGILDSAAALEAEGLDGANAVGC